MDGLDFYREQALRWRSMGWEWDDVMVGQRRLAKLQSKLDGWAEDGHPQIFPETWFEIVRECMDAESTDGMASSPATSQVAEEDEMLLDGQVPQDGENGPDEQDGKDAEAIVRLPEASQEVQGVIEALGVRHVPLAKVCLLAWKNGLVAAPDEYGQATLEELEQVARKLEGNEGGEAATSVAKNQERPSAQQPTEPVTVKGAEEGDKGEEDLGEPEGNSEPMEETDEGEDDAEEDAAAEEDSDEGSEEVASRPIVRLASETIQKRRYDFFRHSSERKGGDSAVWELGNGVDLELVWCPAGTFTMGSPENEPGHIPQERQHVVTLTEGFWMAKYPVTQHQWESVMGNNPSYFRVDENDGRRPVESVGWKDCNEFCRRLGLALPTEAQWEYACRAGSEGPYAKNLRLMQMGWYALNSCGMTRPVDAMGFGNQWGLHDMHGNVSEWCSDWYAVFPPNCLTTDPQGPSTGPFHVMRGGNWSSPEGRCRSASRIPISGYLDGPNKQIGFRPVLNAHEAAN